MNYLFKACSEIIVATYHCISYISSEKKSFPLTYVGFFYRWNSLGLEKSLDFKKFPLYSVPQKSDTCLIPKSQLLSACRKIQPSLYT